MTTQEAKQEIRNKEAYDINWLNDLSANSGISLMTLNFFWNAIKN